MCPDIQRKREKEREKIKIMQAKGDENFMKHRESVLKLLILR